MNNSSDRPRTVIYVRQSKEREDSYSPETQERRCRERADSQGYRVVEVVKDIDVSGRRWDTRPGIQRIVRLAQAGDIDVVMFYWLSRSTRDDEGWYLVKYKIERIGVRLEALDLPNHDPNDPMSNFMREQVAQLAILESNLKSAQWRQVQRDRMELGLYPGGPPPFGYRHNGQRGRVPMVPHPEHADAVRECYRMYLAGRGPAGIAEWLNDRGFRTTPRRMRKRGDAEPVGRLFTQSFVARMLDNPVYVGKIQVHDPACDCVISKENSKRVRYDRDRDEFVPCRRPRIEVDGTHEAIVDAQTWDAYRRAREQRRKPERGRGNTTPQPVWHLGAGLTVCGYCGSNLSINSYTDPYPAARCTTRANTGRSACRGVTMSKLHLETTVALWLGGHVDRWAAEAEAQYDVKTEAAEIVRQVEELRAQGATVRTGLTTALRLVTQGVADEADYLSAKDDADTALRDLAEQVAQLEERHAALTGDSDVYERIRTATPEKTPPEEWNATLKRIIRRVAVTKDEIVVEPWHGEPDTYSRAAIQPRRGKRPPAPRDPETGKFITKVAGG